MSRIGNKPIPLSNKIKVELSDNVIRVSSDKATLEHVLPDLITVEQDEKEIRVIRANDGRQAKSLHGLNRTLIANMVTGVSQGFKKELEIRGVGYRAQVQGDLLTLHLGHSVPMEFKIPDGIKITVEKNVKIIIEGPDKQAVGQVAATIRKFRKPEPYKGKGIRYVGEYVIQKEGKTV